ncbi:MAG: hypothetical protein HZA81_03505 [Candidatus Taylorbacteria bacterium]|nr:hypothetical protein [Candidatus Taylorbacteria bacterium]
MSKKAFTISARAVFFGAVALAVCAVALLYGREGTESTFALRARAEKVGAAEAYQEFKARYAKEDFDTQHNAAHDVGRDLYEIMGSDGFATCDEEFAFGCYHGFIGRAIAEKGVGIIEELARACTERYGTGDTGCKHGIGHGIMEHMGRNKLVPALELCRKTDQPDPLYGCTSGVFMEYNNSIRFDGGIASFDFRRPVDGDMHAPCDELSSLDFRRSCYFEMGAWWSGIFPDDPARVGNMCSEAKGNPERDACYLGWGSVVVESVDRSVSEIKERCAMISERGGQDLCYKGAAMRLGALGLKDGALLICAEARTEVGQSCRGEIVGAGPR